MTYEESRKFEALLRDYAAGNVSAEEVVKQTPRPEPGPTDRGLIDTGEVGAFEAGDIIMRLLWEGVLTSELVQALGTK